MKKITQFALLAFLLISTSNFLQAQENGRMVGQGKIVFEISYPNSQLDQQTLAMMPTESVLYFKGNMSRSEIQMGIGSTAIISDHKLGETITLMDMLGNKSAIKSTKLDAEAERSSNNKPTVELKSDTKVIAGYNCKKAVVSTTGRNGGLTFDVWYTNELMARNSFDSELEGINGFMLEFQTEQNGMTMKMTAKSVEEQQVDDSKFMLPEGYTVMTKEQFKQMYKGGK